MLRAAVRPMHGDRGAVLPRWPNDHDRRTMLAVVQYVGTATLVHGPAPSAPVEADYIFPPSLPKALANLAARTKADRIAAAVGDGDVRVLSYGVIQRGQFCLIQRLIAGVARCDPLQGVSPHNWQPQMPEDVSAYMVHTRAAH